MNVNDEVVNLILKYGMVDGSWHKQWVLDQVLRKILADNYETVIDKFNDDSYPDYESWDVGSPP